jgi:hypothetical protein
MVRGNVQQNLESQRIIKRVRKGRRYTLAFSLVYGIYAKTMYCNQHPSQMGHPPHAAFSTGMMFWVRLELRVLR